MVRRSRTCSTFGGHAGKSCVRFSICARDNRSVQRSRRHTLTHTHTESRRHLKLLNLGASFGRNICRLWVVADRGEPLAAPQPSITVRSLFERPIPLELSQCSKEKSAPCPQVTQCSSAPPAQAAPALIITPPSAVGPRTDVSYKWRTALEYLRIHCCSLRSKDTFLTQAQRLSGCLLTRMGRLSACIH